MPGLKLETFNFRDNTSIKWVNTTVAILGLVLDRDRLKPTVHTITEGRSVVCTFMIFR